jgi:hypothetical protein
LGYSLFNALVLHSYKEHFNFPKYIDVPKMMEENRTERDLKCDPSIEIIEFSEKSFPFLDSKAIEEKLNDRELEKQFFSRPHRSGSLFFSLSYHHSHFLRAHIYKSKNLLE